jgi:amidase
VTFLTADGAHDVHAQLNLSGEPLMPDLKDLLALKPPQNVLEYQESTSQGLEFEAAYSDYWNSTAEQDGKSFFTIQDIRDI